MRYLQVGSFALLLLCEESCSLIALIAGRILWYEAAISETTCHD